MQAMIKVCQRWRVHPATVFVWAWDYFEMRLSPLKRHQIFMSFCVQEGETKKTRTFRLAEVPWYVTDYCLDLLTGRTKVPRRQKQIGGKNESPQ